MITITKEFSWDCAHLLAGHLGACKNLHGHTYKMHLTVSNIPTVQMLPEEDGMVIDFKRLKETVNEKLISLIDHSFVYNVKSEDEVEHAIAKALMKSDRNVFMISYRPTAELMALNFFRFLKEELAAICTVQKVTIWETPTSFATYTGAGGEL